MKLKRFLVCFYLLLGISTPILSQALFTNPNLVQPKLKGHYWNLTGHKIECELKIRISNYIGNGITFKVYKDGKKDGKLTTSDVTSVLYGRDSFVVVNKFMVTPIKKYSKDFSRVIEVGKINLFEHSRKVKKTFYNGTNYIPTKEFEIVTTYLIKTDESEEYHGIYDLKQFEKIFLSMVSHNGELYKKFEEKKDSWESLLPMFVREFNEDPDS